MDDISWMTELNEEDFFYSLLEETKGKYQDSELRQNYPDSDWGYAVCDTPVRKGLPVILGLNWGDKNKTAQKKYPKKDKNRIWPFVSQSRKYIQEFLGYDGVESLNYSNLCFFRSPHIDSLSLVDWNQSFALCEKYLDYIEPPYVLLFGGSSALEVLNSTNSQLTEHWICDGEKRAKVIRGLLFGKFKLVSVPHTNSRTIKGVRRKCWSSAVEFLD